MVNRYKNVNTGIVVETDHNLDSEWEAVSDTADGTDSGYKSLKVDELKAEIDSRNKDREEADRIAPEGTKKDDLIAALEADDSK